MKTPVTAPLKTYRDSPSAPSLKPVELNHWENLFDRKIRELDRTGGFDPAHDWEHIRRVVKTANEICQKEAGCFWVVMPAVWLHDLAPIPKNSPLRSQASRISAEKAVEFLRSIEFPKEYHEEISHCIEAHSFSAGVEVQSKNAAIVQDSDRLDGLGAIGIARCFATAGLLRRPFYDPADPFCKDREPDDSIFTVDHFYKKLFRVAESLKTNSGIEIGKKRTEAMKGFLESLESEIS